MKKPFFFFLLLLSGYTFAQTPATLDPSWDGEGHLVSQSSYSADVIEFQPDGKIVVGLNPQFSNGDAYLARYNADGTFDASFGSNGKKRIEIGDKSNSIEQLYIRNGTIYIGGSTASNTGFTYSDPYLAAVGPSGSYVTSFANNGYLVLNSSSMGLGSLADFTIGPNGNFWMVAGHGFDEYALLKALPSGLLDASFGNGGMVLGTNSDPDQWIFGSAVEIDKSGRVIVAGYVRAGQNVTPYYESAFIERYNSSGVVDATWGTAGRMTFNSVPSNFEDAEDLVITAGNDYIIAGNSYDGSDFRHITFKVEHTGNMDASFGNNGHVLTSFGTNIYSQLCKTLQLLPDGSVMLVGNVSYGDTVRFAALMLNPDGSLNQTFANNGLLQTYPETYNNSSAYGLAFDQNGRMAIGGYCRTCQNGTCGPLYAGISMFNVTFAPPVAVDPAQNAVLTCYPNPTRSGERVRISGLDQELMKEITLTDLRGRQILRISGQSEFVLPHLQAGIYLCKVQTETARFTQKLIVQ